MAQERTNSNDQPKKEQQTPRRRKKRRSAGQTFLTILFYVLFVIGSSILLAAVAWMAANDVLALNKPYKEVTITIRSDDDFSDVTDILHEEGLIEYKPLFKLFASITKGEDKVTMGTYTLDTDMDYRALLAGMSVNSATRAEIDVTIPEGYTVAQIFKLLEEKGIATVDALNDEAANHDYAFAFLDDIPLGDATRLEGYLFPDTYEFYVDDDPANALGRFLRNFDNKLTEEMQADLADLNGTIRSRKLEAGFSASEIHDLTIRDIIIVASLVEKETSGAAESGKIASVIYNRLCSKLYPCLNIDATIQYVLPERKEILTNADKAVISPYNTYTNAGLPVGPISNPGMSSIRAALYPVDTDYYFYALNPAGGHYFSEDVYEHQAFLDSLLGEEEPEEAETEPAEETTETP